MRVHHLGAANRSTILRDVIVSCGLPLVATLIAEPLSHKVNGSAISLYLLAVVGAAAIGGLWSGVGAAILSSLGLTFFFSSPQYSFRYAHAEDFVATIVFLVVAVVVGLLLARSIEERERATQRERDARLLGYLVTKLMSGEPIQTLLDDFANALLDPFALMRCEVRATVDGRELVAMAVRPNSEPGHTEVVPIEMGGVRLGTLTAVRDGGRRTSKGSERSILEAAAKQMAVALERYRLDERARAAQIDAETNQMRAALFSSVTHDLRTPLASIKAGVTSLLDPSATHDERQERELLTTVLEETDRLNRVVGNMMDLSRIRAGALAPARERASIDEITDGVVARMSRQLGGASIRVNLRPDLPDVFVDPLQIDQVLTNLLENAIHYSPVGTEIQVSAASFRDVVQVRVSDRGPGIAPDDRERVFEPFHRGEARSEGGGAGLGLAIARAIATAHGGRIWVEGAPVGGAVLVLELPVWKDVANS